MDIHRFRNALISVIDFPYVISRNWSLYVIRRLIVKCKGVDENYSLIGYVVSVIGFRSKYQFNEPAKHITCLCNKMHKRAFHQNSR